MYSIENVHFFPTLQEGWESLHYLFYQVFSKYSAVFKYLVGVLLVDIIPTPYYDSENYKFGRTELLVTTQLVDAEMHGY